MLWSSWSKMSPDEFKQCRSTLGLTQTELARLLRCGRRTIVNYESGFRPVPGPVSVVLDMLCNDFNPMAEHDAVARGDFAPKWAHDIYGSKA